MTRFVAVDGEAIGQGADARYVLLCASDGHGDRNHLYNPDGLRTIPVFEFLCDFQTARTELVAFGLGYDINQWLVDLSEPELRELWTAGSVIHRGWLIRWLRGRRLFVKDLRHEGRHAYVQETFGFFQSSFVKACAAWGVEVPASMETMKLARGDFTERMREQVIAYCYDECDALVTLMDLLGDAAQTAGCEPTAHMWIGAGQLASRLLANQGVADYHRPDEAIVPADAYEPLLCAYFGGRAELLRQGERAPVMTADVRSAYPWAATQLHSLRHGAQFKPHARYRAEYEHGIWHCRWDNLPGLVMPFPVRVKKTISYPRSGAGWYHACEIRAALDAGFDINVGRGWALHTPSNHGRHAHAQPFDFVPGLFAQRARWQIDGNAAEKALKLALNSLYGKTAQGFSDTDPGKPPKWQSYLWAGEMTARTRARMLTLALRAKDPMMIATDGLFCAYTSATGGTSLGAWETGRLDWLFCAQPGVYVGEDHSRPVGKQMVLKSRGFYVKDIDFEQLHQGWVEHGPAYQHHYTSHRFLGLGQALQRTDGLASWRQWADVERHINLMPQRKLIERSPLGGWTCWPVLEAGGESEPYVPKGALMDPEEEDNNAVEDQPLRDSI